MAISYDATRSVANQVVAHCDDDVKDVATLIVKKHAALLFAMEHRDKSDTNATIKDAISQIWKESAYFQSILKSEPNKANMVLVSAFFQTGNYTSTKHSQLAARMCKLLELAQQLTTCNVTNCVCKT